MRKPFSGVWPALVTPNLPEGGVNESVLRQLTEYLIGKGADGFYVGGTTGEGIFMPAADRKQLVETVLSQVNGRVPILVHVGAVAVGDAIDLARHARDHGAAGISSIIPPLYDSIDIITRYFETLANAVPDISLYSYLLNPSLDAVALMQRLAQIPSVAGTKYTGSDMFELQQIIELSADDWTIFSGMDEQCVYAAMMGATGCIGSTLNIMPGVYAAIRANVEQGNYAKAQELQVSANHVTAAMARIGFQGALYEVLGMLGFDCAAPRLPRIPLTDAQRGQLREMLDATDFRALVEM
ncbi:MAG: dihydrodipicolinate synthase family protein [Anaerolineae bacterium]|nr:dihydrodipicolinate synthase family protein [Anaerolineae bacterium]